MWKDIGTISDFGGGGGWSDLRNSWNRLTGIASGTGQHGPARKTTQGTWRITYAPPKAPEGAFVAEPSGAGVGLFDDRAGCGHRMHGLLQRKLAVQFETAQALLSIDGLVRAGGDNAPSKRVQKAATDILTLACARLLPQADLEKQGIPKILAQSAQMSCSRHTCPI